VVDIEGRWPALVQDTSQWGFELDQNPAAHAGEP